jgi:hypothetical protein
LLTHFGVWRGAVLALTLGAGLAVFAWLAGREHPVGVWAAFGMVGATGLLLGVGLSLAKVRPTELCWDAQCWSVRSLLAKAEESVPGDVSIAIDLGGWMLLRFRPLNSSRWVRTTWLPVQRRGLEPHWQALRCALYSSRNPAAADLSARR